MNKLVEFDNQYWSSGLTLLGVDEAGYGCFAGSMFVAGVAFNIYNINEKLLKVKDSKKLNEETRFDLESLIKENADFWFCEEVTVDELNSSSPYYLRFSAAQRGISKLIGKNKNIDVVIYDGDKSLDLDLFKIKSLNQIKGDGISFSIAAASILAKTAKDREMQEKDRDYPQYGFALNKGYYSKEHGLAIKKHGMSPHHRPQYCKNYI